MRKKIAILTLFWWAILFPQFSLNPYTTILMNDNLAYPDLSQSEILIETLQNAEYDFWLFNLLSTNQ